MRRFIIPFTFVLALFIVDMVPAVTPASALTTINPDNLVWD